MLLAWRPNRRVCTNLRLCAFRRGLSSQFLLHRQEGTYLQDAPVKAHVELLGTEPVLESHPLLTPGLRLDCAAYVVLG